MHFFKTPARVTVFAVALAAALTGCDSLHARMIAQQAVDLYHRNEIAAAKSEITVLQSELHEPGANKPDIIRQIRELQRAIAVLRGEGNALHCTL